MVAEAIAGKITWSEQGDRPERRNPSGWPFAAARTAWMTLLRALERAPGIVDPRACVTPV